MAKREKGIIRVPEMENLTITENTPVSTLYNYYVMESNEKKKQFYKEAWTRAYRKEKELRK